MPKAALLGQSLPSAQERLAEIQNAAIARRTNQAPDGLAAKKATDAAEGRVGGAPTPASLARQAFRAEIEARIIHSVTTDAPLVERLVLFWSNHFAVSAAKGSLRGIVGGFEREAIRPYVLGSFSDMVQAVAQHPAMLIYLDNVHSVGPSSAVGRRRRRGLNENLAREILELHTLGVGGGYTQDDVRALAVLLTGWTVGHPSEREGIPGRFFFDQTRHEPGGASVLGKTYKQGGTAEGRAVLQDLAQHPSTARHIAGKLAKHFVGDATPAGLVERLEQAFLKSSGDLSVVVSALISAPEAWQTPPQKVVPPYDFLVSLVRGFAQLEPPVRIHRFAASLGHVTWTPTSPKGWPDGDQDWAGPSALRERLRIVEVFAQKVAPALDPRSLADQLLGPHLTTATRLRIERAEARTQGLEILAMSPEFLRR